MSQVVRGHGLGGLSVDLHAGVECLQRGAVERRHQRAHDGANLWMRQQDRLAHRGDGRIDGLVVAVVREQDEVGRDDAAVRAVHHCGVDVVGAGRRGADRGGGFAAGQHDLLSRFEVEAVGALERAQRPRVCELGGAGEHHVAARADPAREIAHGTRARAGVPSPAAPRAPRRCSPAPGSARRCGCAA